MALQQAHSQRIAISLGDPRGIGPEVASAAARFFKTQPERPYFIFVGPEGTGAEVDADEFVSIGTWHSAGDAATAGRLAGLAIVRATELVIAGAAHALVTAPIDKSALHAGGYHFPGHTEMLAHLAGVPAAVMMMAAEHTALGGPLRVVLATTHLPLADVSRALSQGLIMKQARVTAHALRTAWEIGQPRIALCALNPHASDGGLFGDEEQRIFIPACAALQEEGIHATGPIPADTVFVRALRGEFDAVIAPYHDVGMAAFKTAAFGDGVNVTLGLPFVRTSPDHGTALDIAGKGVADASSMVEAVRLAARLAAHKFSTVS